MCQYLIGLLSYTRMFLNGEAFLCVRSSPMRLSVLGSIFMQYALLFEDIYAHVCDNGSEHRFFFTSTCSYIRDSCFADDPA